MDIWSVSPPQELNRQAESVCYLPHHFVLKDSSTTKLRVVFDASAKTSSGVSLNDKLLVGPKLQDDLVPLLIRFRTHQVALCADVAKMYRQVRVCQEDADYQRIVWRENSSEQISDFRLVTVTYGTASAPYLSTRVLQQIAIDEGEAYPLAARVVERDFYVDDYVSGASSVEEAVEMIFFN